MFVERFSKSFIFHCLFSKSVITTVKGIQDYPPLKGGNGANGKITGAHRHLTGDQHGETVRKPLRGDNRILNVGLSPKQS